jgi:hypothetical protein
MTDLRLCECGCGEIPPLSSRNRPSRGIRKGEPSRYVPGHQRMRSADPAALFKRNVHSQADGCWHWTGRVARDGYGFLHVGGGRYVLAHRWSYEHHVGPIPEGLTIDHLCRVRHCVNPEHLEPVTQRVNNLRSESEPAKNARKTHCKRGHEFTPENTYRHRDGRRECGTCKVLRRVAAS